MKEPKDYLHEIDRILNEVGIPVGKLTEEGAREYTPVERLQLLVNKTREGWVSVKESLPKPEIDVMVFGTASSGIPAVGVASIFPTGGWWTVPSFVTGIDSELSISDITHWKSLPKPIKP